MTTIDLKVPSNIGKSMQDQFADISGKPMTYHMKYLTKYVGNHLKILPTSPHLRFRYFWARILKKLEEWFVVKPLVIRRKLGINAFSKAMVFWINDGPKILLDTAFQSEFRKVSIKTPPFPYRNLDLVVLHELVFYSNTEWFQIISAFFQLVYERNFPRCIQEVVPERLALAIITQEIELISSHEVCNSRACSASKSLIATYLSPKVGVG